MKLTPILLFNLALSTMSSLTFASDKVVESMEYQREVALYNDKEHSNKCSVAFEQLRNGLKNGMTSTEASRVFRDAKWLQHSHTYEITRLGGMIPVDMVPERAFAMHLYPNADKWSNHVVYYSISCPGDDCIQFTIEDFLQGKVKNDHVKIHQVALCHPGKSRKDIGLTEFIPPKD
jgi:hypothetical protein